MGLITGGQILPGEAGPFLNAGAPSNGTDEVVTITVTGTPTGGTYKLKHEGFLTASIAYNAAASAVQTALRNLPSIGGSNVTVSGSGGGPYTVTGAADLAKKVLSAITLAENALTGGTDPSVTITEDTPGVDASFRGAPKGALLVDTTNGVLYMNTGSSTVPVWSAVASSEIADVLTNIPVTTIAAVATADADATYGSPEATLLNELKTQMNLVIAALKTAKIVALA